MYQDTNLFKWFQRRMVLNDATISNLNSLCLMLETATITLAHDINKMDFHENALLNGVIVDYHI
jgi:hypothetical protein